jgi:hypothetical protein
MHVAISAVRSPELSASPLRPQREQAAAASSGAGEEVLAYLTLAPGEAARLPAGIHRVRAVRGTAHLTHAGRDLILWAGEPAVTLEADARAERELGPVVASPLGGEETVLEFCTESAEEGARWLTALFAAGRSGWRKRWTRFWSR